MESCRHSQSSNQRYKHHLDPQISLISPTSIQAFLSDLDDLHDVGFNGDNDMISAFLRIVEIMLKLIGNLLSASLTWKISAKAGKKYVTKYYTSVPLVASSITSASINLFYMCNVVFALQMWSC